MQGVVPVDQHEGRLQQVIAVGPPAGDVQEQVELGRRRNVVEGPHQCSKTTRRSAAGGGVARCARRRPWLTWLTSTCQPGTSVARPSSQSNKAAIGKGVPVTSVANSSSEANWRVS